MPILAPDRNKGKIAGIIMGNLRPSMADQMRMGAENNFAKMGQVETDEPMEQSIEAGAMALRAMFSAMQDGDYEAAFRAFMSADKICDALEGENEGY